MSFEHFVDKELNLLRVRRWGATTIRDEGRASRERQEDPLVVPGIPVLIDCTGVQPNDEPETVKYLADFAARISTDLQCGPVAIVVATDVEFGMARMYQAFTNLAHPATEVFRSEAAALEWLGLG